MEEAEENEGLPTTALPYSPAEQSAAFLRPDWPDTPLSSAGLSEGVVQKLRFLARDLPHGYWTPKQIAERFLSGGLVRFEDQAHKEQVLGWAEQMEREKYGSEARVSEFSAVADKEADRKGLVDQMARGVYPELEKGQRPLLAGIHRQLRNNETYGGADTAAFVGRIETLIGGVQRAAQQQQKQATAEK